MQFEAPEELDHAQVFEDAWKDSSSTSIELPPVDVNQVLSNRYSTSEPVTLTRNMMWDLVDRFERMAEDPWLPEYVEIYLRKDLNVELIRQE